MKGICFYTDSRIEEPIKSLVQGCIYESRLPITSVSLKPMYFGKNFVVQGERGFVTMTKQILTALENSKEDYVFFCEHDVLYHKSHFDFEPPKDDTYYYNLNNWRWDYPNDRLIHYDGLTSLSQLCCSRELALDHYKRRMRRIEELGEDKFSSNEPDIARKWGYEPGRKKTKNGGFADEKTDNWHSEFPNIDIRHKHTFSPPKTKLANFKHLPTGWVETSMYNINGWDLKGLFNL
jgi:hypothetical protein